MFIPSKVSRPNCPPNLIARDRIVNRVLENIDRKLTLITAPFGFGKTCLAFQIAEQAAHEAYWFRLDERDGYLAGFYTYLCKVLEAEEDAELVKVGSPWALAGHVTSLLYELSAPAVIVLDDFHHCDTSPDIISFMQGILAYLPPTCHFILTSRSQTRLNLASLALNQELNLVTERDLSFTAAEAASLAHQLGHTEDVTPVLEESGGWPAGLSLMLDRDLAELSGGVKGSLNHYLEHELITSLNEQERQFAYTTALVCPTTEQTLVALGVEERLIDRFLKHYKLLYERDGRLDYQPVVSAFLLEHCKRETPELWREINSEVGQTLWEAGNSDGLRYLANAGEDMLAKGLDRVNFDAFQGDLWTEFGPYVSQLPYTPKKRPLLTLLQADSLALSEPRKALSLYEDVFRVADTEAKVRASALVGIFRAKVVLRRYSEVVTTFEATVERIEDPYLHALLLNQVAGAYSGTNQFEKAEALFKEVIAVGKSEGSEYLEITGLAGLASTAFYQGFAELSLDYDRQILNYDREHNNRYGIASSLNALATSHYCLGNLTESFECASEAVSIARELQIDAKLLQYMGTLGTIQLALMHLSEAEATFQKVLERAARDSYIYCYSHCRMARIKYLQGDVDQAQAHVGSVFTSTAGKHWTLLEAYNWVNQGLLRDSNQRQVEDFKQALELFGVAGAHFEQAHTYKLLSLSHTDPEASRTYRQQAETLEERLGYVIPLHELTRSSVPPLVPVKETTKGHLEIRTLGKLTLELQGKTLTTSNWNGRKAKDIVLFLAASKQGASRDTIIDCLWHEDELQLPEQQFSIALSRARRALGGRRTIVRDGQTYSFGDLLVEEDAMTLLDTPVDAAPTNIRTALDLYQGEYLSGYYVDWVLERRSRIENHFLQLTAVLLSGSIEPDLQKYAASALTVDDAHEEAHEFLLRLYIQSGKYRSAKDQYLSYASAVTALGGTPNPRLTDLLDT